MVVVTLREKMGMSEYSQIENELERLRDLPIDHFATDHIRPQRFYEQLQERLKADQLTFHHHDIASLGRLVWAEAGDCVVDMAIVDKPIANIADIANKVQDDAEGYELDWREQLHQRWLPYSQHVFGTSHFVDLTSVVSASPSPSPSSSSVSSSHSPLTRLETKRGLVCGTSFQCHVWKVLCRIPFGKRVTYGWVAEQVGTQGVRAVGSAIGQNRLAPAIPCHRVVRKSGELGGYRWGLPMKQQLLAVEEDF